MVIRWRCENWSQASFIADLQGRDVHDLGSGMKSLLVHFQEAALDFLWVAAHRYASPTFLGDTQRAQHILHAHLGLPSHDFGPRLIFQPLCIRHRRPIGARPSFQPLEIVDLVPLVLAKFALDLYDCQYF